MFRAAACHTQTTAVACALIMRHAVSRHTCDEHTCLVSGACRRHRPHSARALRAPPRAVRQVAAAAAQSVCGRQNEGPCHSARVDATKTPSSPRHGIWCRTCLRDDWRVVSARTRGCEGPSRRVCSFLRKSKRFDRLCVQHVSRSSAALAVEQPVGSRTSDGRSRRVRDARTNKSRICHAVSEL